MFKQIRILILLCILLFVALNEWQSKARSTRWHASLWVAVYPINGDGSPATARYIDNLNTRKFYSIETFMQQQAKVYQLKLSTPVRVKLGPVIDELPPVPPDDRNILGVMWWSLIIRYWAANITENIDGPPADIKIFVIYYDPKVDHKLGHSLGLEKGLLGIVNAYASPVVTEYNNIIITHELLHTVGASDKYNLNTGLPVYPQGYAESSLLPLYPQRRAEIMAGKIPLSETETLQPRSLGKVLIGEETAIEINWLN